MAEQSKILQSIPSVIVGILMFIGGISTGSIEMLFFGIIIALSGIVKIVQEQQKRAEGAHFVGQPQDVGAYGWERLEKLMENVDNPDTFVIEMAEQQQRSEATQARMAETFHGDSTTEFRGDSVQTFYDDSVQEFRGDSVSNWSEHTDSVILGPETAPSGMPSAVPKDFHQASLYWEDPTRKWSDPYA